ncbi:MAG: ABC transporter permease [Pygmaiobacter sp.]|nr:ABC transporter permease [Pygmaiobacter sp.]
MKAFKTLLKTEIKLSLRDMNMPIFAIIMPFVVTVLIGLIYGDKAAYPGAPYTFLQQSFGALVTIAICAGGVMGLPLVVAGYRQKKILKRFRTTPTGPVLLLGVQLVLYALYAIASLVLTFLAAWLLFGFHFWGSPLLFTGTYLLVMLSMFSIGLLVGGVARDEKIASILASVLYFPMLVFSGATLPYEVMPPVLQRFADVLPLTQGIKLLKATTLGLPLGSVWFPLVLLAGVAVVCTVLAVRFFRWE